jgi:uncharacterized protein (DUF427 family)
LGAGAKPYGDLMRLTVRGFAMRKPSLSLHIRPNYRRVRAMFQGHVIADTARALVVFEPGYAPVQYFPRQDVDLGYFGKTRHRSTCPHKGEASYYTITMDGLIAENAAWSYEEPIASASALKDRIAFYPNVVELYELSPAEEARMPYAAHAHGEPAER